VAERAELALGFAGDDSGDPPFGGVHLTVRVHLGEVLSGSVWRAGREREGLQTESVGAGRSWALSYKLYCDALTTTDGRCQTFSRLAALSIFGKQWGRSGEGGQPPAIAASAPAPGLLCPF
jgi:hypothetical protein